MNKHLKAVLFASSAILFSAPSYAQQGTVIGGGTSSVSCGPGITGCPSGPLSPTQALGNSGAAITGTTYTVDLTNNITTSDLARELVFTGSSASAWTLGAGSNGMGFDVVNRGTADITITATGNINGNSTLVIQPGLSANIFFGNSTWNAFNIPITTSSQFGAMKPDNSTITCTAGVCSAAGSGTVVSPSNYTAGNFFFTSPSAKGTSATGMTSGTVYFTDLTVFKPITINQLGTYVATLDAAGHFALGIYAVDGTTGYATGAPLVTTSSLSTASVAVVMDTGLSSTALAAGHYKLGFMTDSATAQFMNASGGAGYEGYAQGSDTAAHMVANVTTYDTVYSIAGTYGSWPTMNGTLCGTGNCTTITSGFSARNVVGIMKVASVP